MLDSSTKKTFTLLISPSLSAKENMLIDKELFDSFKNSSLPTFRVYEWEPSFSYGISQKIDSIKNLEDLKKYHQNYAQRMTGGGILFHGNDISYSLIIPISYVKSLSVKESYELLCRFLIHFYKSLGLNPIYAKDIESIDLSKSQYCQQGFEPYDILVNGKKVGGNAQRRSKESIFQHGSISINNSTYSIGNSLEDLDIKISFEAARKLLLESFSQTFNIVFDKENREARYAS